MTKMTETDLYKSLPENTSLEAMKGPMFTGDIMSRVEIREERCKGCLLCTTVCPTGVLVQSERMNDLGYKVVHMPTEGMEQCKGCAFCAQICPDMVIRVFRSQNNGDGHED